MAPPDESDSKPKTPVDPQGSGAVPQPRSPPGVGLDDDWEAALETWDASFADLSRSVSPSPPGPQLPGVGVSRSITDDVTPERAAAVHQALAGAGAVGAPKPGPVPALTGGEGSSSGALVIPDLAVLEAAASGSPPPVGVPTRQQPPPIPGASPSQPAPRDERALHAEDGLPELSGVFAADALASAAAGKADDPFTRPLPAEPPVALDLALGAPRTGAFVDAIVAALPESHAGLTGGDRRGHVLLFVRQAEASNGVAAARLFCAAARRAEPGEKLALYERALAVAPRFLPALRGRFVQRLADRSTEVRDALAALLDALPSDERVGYASLQSALASAGLGSHTADDRDHLIRALDAATATATSARREAEAAAALEALAPLVTKTAAHPVAVSLRALASRLRELTGHHQGDTSPAGLPASVRLLSALRAAGVDAAHAVPELDDLNTVPEPLRSGFIRWALQLVLGTGRNDAEAAAKLRTALVSGDDVLCIDRLAALATTGAMSPDLVDRSVDVLLGVTSASSAADAATRAVLARHLAEALVARHQLELAAKVLAAIPRNPVDDITRALGFEAVARAAPDPTMRREALRAWADGDPARRAHALWRLSEQATGDERTALLAEIATASPTDPSFAFAYGLLDPTVEGPQRAAALERGAAAFRAAGDETLAAALAERADELRAQGSPEAGMAKRLAGITQAPTAGGAALALAVLQAEGDARKIANLFVAAADASDSPWRRLEAVVWLLQAGGAREAMQRLVAQEDRNEPLTPGGDVLLHRLARMYADAPTRDRILGKLAERAPPAARPEILFQRAEALEAAGTRAEAAELYRDLLVGPLALEADLALRRVLWSTRNGEALAALLRDEIDARAGAGQVEAAARRLMELARVLLELRDDPRGAAAATEEALLHDPSRTDARMFLLLLRLQHEDAEPTQLLDLLGTFARRDAPSIAVSVVYVSALLARHRFHIDAARSVVEAYAGEPKGSGGSPSLPLALLRLGLDLVDTPGTANERAARIMEALAERLGSTEAGDPRLAAVLALRAAEILHELGNVPHARALLARAQRAEEGDRLVPAAYAESVARARGAWAEAVSAGESAAALMRRPENRAAALLRAASLAEEHLGDAPRAIALLYAALDAQPTHDDAFRRLRRLLESAGRLEDVGALLAARVSALGEAAEAETLQLERVDLLAGPLADRVRAKAELRALLSRDSQNGKALGRLAAMELEDGANAVAAELLIRRGRFERDPGVLMTIFLQIGRIYWRLLSDPKLAIGAYERALALAPTDREALEALSDLYTKQGDLRKALVVTERTIDLETDPGKRLGLLLRHASLLEKSGELHRAGSVLKRAADESPRSLQAVGEAARFYERNKEPQARHVVLDRAIGLLRDDLRSSARDVAALRTLVPLLRWRQRNACSAAAAQLLALLSNEPSERHDAAAWAAPPASGRRLAPLANPELDERLRPAPLAAGLRNLLRIVGPALAKATKPDVRRHGVGRADRQTAGSDVRAAFDPIALDLGVRGVEIYVSKAAPAALVVEPGDDPVVIVGTDLVALGPTALRFVAGHALRLLETHLAFLATGTPTEAAALLVAIVRQLTPSFDHQVVTAAAVESAAPRVAKALSSRVTRAEATPFAVEIAAPFEPHALREAVLQAGFRAGLLASGDLAAGLQVIATEQGAPVTLATAFELRSSAQLVDFALGEDHEELVAALEAVT